MTITVSEAGATKKMAIKTGYGADLPDPNDPGLEYNRFVKNAEENVPRKPYRLEGEIPTRRWIYITPTHSTIDFLTYQSLDLVGTFEQELNA